MITAISHSDVSPSRFEGEIFNGTKYARTDYLGSDTSDYDTPQALLVEQWPNSVIPPHFHGINQYQVVVHGAAVLGKHALAPVAIHYSAGYSGYGPITTSDEGVFYFTLRAQSEPGAFFLPESRDRQKPGRRRNLMAEVPCAPTDAKLPPIDAVAMESIIELEEGGLGAWLLRMGPSMESTGPDPMQGGGQYYVVLNGSLEYEGADYEKWSLVYVTPPESTVALKAGAEGVEVLVLQFPREKA